jgi:hypothetical protein
MESKTVYLLMADVILFIHLLFVIFIILGFILIFIGKLRSWFWILNPWFRLTHLISIGAVVLQSWMSLICPLTTWEMRLRENAGESVYIGTFISHWLDRILFYQVAEWVFIIIYTVFGGLVLASWFWIRPHPFSILKHNDKKIERD